MAEPMAGNLDNLAIRSRFKHYSRPTQLVQRSKPQLFSDVTDQFASVYQKKIDQTSQPVAAVSMPDPVPVVQAVATPLPEPVQETTPLQAAPNYQQVYQDPQPVNQPALNQVAVSPEPVYSEPEYGLPQLNPSQHLMAPIYNNNYGGEYEDTKYHRVNLKAVTFKKFATILGTSVIAMAVIAGCLYTYTLITGKSLLSIEPTSALSTSGRKSGISTNSGSASTSSSSGGVTLPGQNQPPATSYASEVQPTKSQIASYAVGVSQPRYLIIPQLNIDSMITPVNLNTKNDLDAPNNIYNVGWWQSSSLPGQSGAVILDGFINDGLDNGVFSSLNKLKPGSTFQVEIGNTDKATYKVIKSSLIGSEGVTMDQAIEPVSTSVNALNIITCTGQTLTCPSAANQDFVVYTEQVN